MKKYYFRKITTEMKVYALVLFAIVLLVAYFIYASGYIKEKTFDDLLFNEQACVRQKRAFNFSSLKRKSLEDVENINYLIPVVFNNMSRGTGLHGVIDVDGSVVVEPTFKNRIEVFGGIIRTLDDQNQAYFYDLENNELPIKEASPLFYAAKREARRFKEVNTNPIFTLISKASLGSAFVDAIESQAKLELYYMSYYKEPQPFYSVRLHSSKHERVFTVFDADLNFINQEYFLDSVYFEENGIARVHRVCGVAYMNMDGEYIFFDDSDY